MRWALIGGASQGIGEATARELAVDHRVVLMSRSRDKLEAVQASLPRSNEHLVFPFDLEEVSALPQDLDQLLQKTGPIEIVVNNSGGPSAGALIDTDPLAFEKAIRAHVVASQIILQKLLPGMKERGFGRVVNIISTSVKMPIPNLGVSNTVRGAMANWSKTLAMEVGMFGVTVNNVLPGYTETPRLEKLVQAASKRQNLSEAKVREDWKAKVPMRRFGKPEEIAAAIGFLASEKAGYINGTNIVVDGGRTGCL